jgi:hypothetical protein
MLSCDEISHSTHFVIYRNDTIKNILSLINTNKYDEVLKESFMNHIKYSKNPSASFKKQDKGWCRDLKTLLLENSFQNDINDMLGITDVDFCISDYLIKKPLPGKEDEIFDSPTDEFRAWLSSIFKVNINNATFIEYDHDINLAEFNNARYLLLRDINEKLYLVVYTVDGEYLEEDLINISNKKDFSSEFRLKFYNKYNHNNK